MKKKSETFLECDFTPAKSNEERENQLIALAVDRAEQQLRDGTASSQVIVHYLRLGSTKEKLEKEMMKEQKKLLEAKTEMINSSKRIEELYSKAIAAMRRYSGEDNDEDEQNVF